MIIFHQFMYTFMPNSCMVFQNSSTQMQINMQVIPTAIELNNEAAPSKARIYKLYQFRLVGLYTL
jgi:hypothetical protein